MSEESKPDELDALLGEHLERARAAAPPRPDPLAENPKLAEALREASALSTDGTPFGPPIGYDDPIRDSPESERVEQASAPLAPMRQHTQPVERVKVKYQGHTTIKGRAVAPVARMPGEPHHIDPPGPPVSSDEPIELPVPTRHWAPLAMAIAAAVVVGGIGWWAVSASSDDDRSRAKEATELPVAPKAGDTNDWPLPAAATRPTEAMLGSSTAGTANDAATGAERARPAKTSKPRSSSAASATPRTPGSTPSPTSSAPPSTSSDRFQD